MPGAVGAALIFAGAAAAGAWAAAMLGARGRVRSPARLAIVLVLATILVAAGAALVRPEARAPVALFALIPFIAGFVLAWLDLRAARR